VFFTPQLYLSDCSFGDPYRFAIDLDPFEYVDEVDILPFLHCFVQSCRSGLLSIDDVGWDILRAKGKLETPTALYDISTQILLAEKAGDYCTKNMGTFFIWWIVMEKSPRVVCVEIDPLIAREEKQLYETRDIILQELRLKWPDDGGKGAGWTFQVV